MKDKKPAMSKSSGESIRIWPEWSGLMAKWKQLPIEPRPDASSQALISSLAINVGNTPPALQQSPVLVCGEHRLGISWYDRKMGCGYGVAAEI